MLNNTYILVTCLVESGLGWLGFVSPLTQWGRDEEQSCSKHAPLGLTQNHYVFCAQPISALKCILSLLVSEATRSIKNADIQFDKVLQTLNFTGLVKILYLGAPICFCNLEWIKKTRCIHLNMQTISFFSFYKAMRQK